MERAYIEAFERQSNKTIPQTKTQVPEGELTLPELFESVLTLAQVVPVSIYAWLPPTVDLILKVVNALATNSLPPAVL